MVAKRREQPAMEACRAFKKAENGLRAMGKAMQDAAPCIPRLLGTWSETEMAEQEKLRIDLGKFIIIARDISGANNRDYTLKLSAADVHDLIPLLTSLNTPDVWPIGREIEVRLSQDDSDWVPAQLVAYSNHYDWMESAYPIYVKMTLRYMVNEPADKE